MERSCCAVRKNGCVGRDAQGSIAAGGSGVVPVALHLVGGGGSVRVCPRVSHPCSHGRSLFVCRAVGAAGPACRVLLAARPPAAARRAARVVAQVSLLVLRMSRDTPLEAFLGNNASVSECNESIYATISKLQQTDIRHVIRQGEQTTLPSRPVFHYASQGPPSLAIQAAFSP